jgi:DNA (cytosine-5)-methyltransferase 1
MKFVSLFAGVGGFDLGLERSGHTCVGQVEIDKHARSVLELQFPDVPKHDDVTTAIDWADQIGLTGNIDLVCGGFPCQDLSVAGKRAGLAGARSGLFYDALRFATHTKAETILLENVSGLLSSNQGRDFGAVLTALADSGYSNIEWRVLDSQFFGVPQRRRRIFIVASVGTKSFTQILTKCESSSRHSQSSQQKGQDTSNNITKIAVAEDREPRIGSFELYTFPNEDKSPALSARRASDMLQYDSVKIKNVRRLTPKECERLQGFPDDWTFKQSDAHRYKQMGNAVTVNVIESIGQQLGRVSNG